MAHLVMAPPCHRCDQSRVYSYGPDSYGLYSYDPSSHGTCSSLHTLRHAISLTYIVMARIVMAYTIMTYLVMAPARHRCDQPRVYSYDIRSYGPDRYGLNSYGPSSHGTCSSLYIRATRSVSVAVRPYHTLAHRRKSPSVHAAGSRQLGGTM